jgi:hypothetical protein
MKSESFVHIHKSKRFYELWLPKSVIGKAGPTGIFEACRLDADKNSIRAYALNKGAALLKECSGYYPVFARRNGYPPAASGRT